MLSFLVGKYLVVERLDRCVDMFSFSRSCQAFLQGGCTDIHTPVQQCMRVLICSRPHEQLDLPVFSIIAILVDVL